MVCKGIVHAGVVEPSVEVALPEGIEVRIETDPEGVPASCLLRHAGTWHGDDADRVIETIYADRSVSNRGENL